MEIFISKKTLDEFANFKYEFSSILVRQQIDSRTFSNGNRTKYIHFWR